MPDKALVVLLVLLSGCAEDSPVASAACEDEDGDGICNDNDMCPDSDDGSDADGDGVPDGCDICPQDAADDTDGDGVCDGEDVCPQDADDDTDGDGVCDSDDLCPGHDDSIDEDEDGAPDSCDACPVDELDDRDGDGLCDSDDPCPDDDPDDSDGDGVCDTWDVCSGVDDDLDDDLDGVPDGCVCNVLDIPAPAGAKNVPGGFINVGYAFEGIVGPTGIMDYGFGQPLSAVLRLEFTDGASWFCSIWFDLTAPGLATPSNADWVNQMPVTPFAAWDLSLSNGQTDCAEPMVSDDILPGQEEGVTGLAIGPMDQLEAKLRMDPMIDTNWTTDWEPYVMSLYVRLGDDPPVEASYMFQYDRTCDMLKQDPHTLERVLLPKAQAGPLLEYYEAYPVPIFG